MADPSKSILAALLIIIISSSGIAELEPGDAKVIRSSQILSQIVRGEPVEYHGVTVIGDLDLRETRTSKPNIINSSLKIENSEIYGIVNLSGYIIEKPVSFEGTKFMGPANFLQTRFMKGANFSQTIFNDSVVLRKALICESAAFGKAQFNGPSDFWKIKIMADTADFEGTQFIGPAQFWMAQFEAEDVNFEWSEFGGFASFWGAKFGEIANFRGTRFKDGIDLTMVQFNGTADFSGVRVNKGMYFNDVKFRTFIVQWSSIGAELVCNGPPYLQLIKNFKDREQFEDADDCYYQYRSWKLSNRPIGWLKLFDFLAWISCGYGVRWAHPILSGALVTMLFALYYELYSLQNQVSFLSLKKSLMNIDKYDLKRRMKVTIIFSAAILLSLPSEWYPYGRDEYAKLLKTHLCSAILERMVGWGLMLLLIGTLTRLMVRY